MEFSCPCIICHQLIVLISRIHKDNKFSLYSTKTLAHSVADKQNKMISFIVEDRCSVSTPYIDKYSVVWYIFNVCLVLSTGVGRVEASITNTPLS